MAEDRGIRKVREEGMGAALFGYSKLNGRVPGGQAQLLRVPYGYMYPLIVFTSFVGGQRDILILIGDYQGLTADGQYILVMKGGIQHEGKLKKDLTIIWVGKNEGPFELVAGPEGMEGLILNFPVPGGGMPEEVKATVAGGDGEFKTWQCILCAFVYDEEAGFPEEGIAPGTRWADVPEDFGCPDCSAKKADFEMIEF